MKTIPQRLNHLNTLLKNTTLGDRPDTGSYAYEGEVKTGQQRKEGYLRLIKSIRDTYNRNNGLIPRKMEQALSNLERELQL